MTPSADQQGDKPPVQSTPAPEPIPAREPHPDGGPDAGIPAAGEGASGDAGSFPLGGAVAVGPRRSRAVPALLSIAAAVALFGIAFTVGRMTAPAAAPTTGAAVLPGGVGTGPGGLPGGPTGESAPGFLDRDGGLGPSVQGTVTSITGDQLSIKLSNGQTVTVATGSSTTYHAQTSAARSDLAPGTTVSVRVGLVGTPGAGSTTMPLVSDVTITRE